MYIHHVNPFKPKSRIRVLEFRPTSNGELTFKRNSMQPLIELPYIVGYILYYIHNFHIYQSITPVCKCILCCCTAQVKC